MKKINSSAAFFLNSMFQIVWFFVIDICMFSLYSQPMSYMLLCVYILHILEPATMICVGCAAFFIFIESFLYSGNLLAPLLYLIPITFCAFQVRKICYLNRFLYVVLSLGSLFIYIFLIEGMLMHTFCINYYTFIKIAVNMVLIVFFSLKLHSQSSRDNRCLWQHR